MSAIVLPVPVVGWIRGHSARNYWRVAGWYELDDLINDGLLKAYQCIATYGRPGGPGCPACGSVESRTHIERRGKTDVTCYICRSCQTPYIDHPLFMSLVKTSFYTHIGELLRWKRGVDDITSKINDLAGEVDEQLYLAFITPAEPPQQDMIRLVAEMPDRLRKVVEFYLLDDPKRLWRHLRTRLEGPDETLSERLRKLTGFPEDADFETELRTYLWEREAGIL
jgi:hypothetical protein